MTDSVMQIHYTLPPEFPFPWCSAWGEDRKGIWVEFAVRYGEGKKSKVKQRMRWINPGRFMMGSPAGEKERDDDEVLHEVNLTKGFWLADTACTQELWEVVMGENPSRFKGKQRPVENVSWDNCREFFQNIKSIPALADITLCLPTEAQWEYACRAGARILTPFSFGETITPDQANYDGNYPYDEGEKGKYREETVDVKSFPSNAWGLYEMHGNVLEWCSDWYDEQYYNQCKEQGIVENPKGPDSGGGRVLRGGSWDGDARDCRSASRSWYDPGHRHILIGFRLSRGQ